MEQAHSMPLVITNDGRGTAALDVNDVWDALDAHGALLFHGFDPGADGFYDFASRFNRAFLTSPFGDRKHVNHDNELQTVTLGQAGLSLHFEFGNSPWRPDLLWLYCRTPAAEGMGGETLLSDGAATYDKLSAATQQQLRERRIRYTNYLPRESFDAIFTDNATARVVAGGDVVAALRDNSNVNIVEMSDTRVIFELSAPALGPTVGGGQRICQNIFTEAYKRPSDRDAENSFSTQVTWDDGSPIEQAFIDELRTAAFSLTRGIKWRAGNFALVDNNRVLHGRRPTKDPARDLLILCSFSTRYEA